MQPLRQRKTAILLGSSLLVLIVLMVVAVAALSMLREKPQPATPSVPANVPGVVEYQGRQYIRSPGIDVTLLLGLDTWDKLQSSGAHYNLVQSDFISLLVCDTNAKSYRMLQLNRDMMVAVDILGLTGEVISTQTQQLTLAHNQGNGLDASSWHVANTISRLLGEIPIQRHITVSMGAIPILNDLIGGVTVTLLDDFTDINPAMTKGSQHTLRGNEALSYLRARDIQEDESNLPRMARQQQYIDAVYRQLKAENPIKEINSELLSRLDGYLLTSSSLNGLSDLQKKLETFRYDGLVELAGSYQKGAEFMEFYTDPNDLQAVILTLFYEPYQPLGS